MTITPQDFAAMNQDDKVKLLKSDLSAWNIAHHAYYINTLYGANLYGANLRGADLYRANLYGANLRGANLYGANLRGANLYGANLYGANLRGADLYGANLRWANLRGADLRGANLRGADLRGANLYGANLYGANLRGADLRGANLRGANLYGANLRGEGMTVESWCDLLDLAFVGRGQRLAFKRLPADRITGRNHNDGKNLIEWKRGATVEAPDWNEEAECGNGLHLSPDPQSTRIYSSNDLVVPIAFDPKDAVLLGDKIKVRKCKVLG